MMGSNPPRPLDCCPSCGAHIGLIGRALQWIGLGLHRCPGVREAYDAALARRANAEAERLELENAEMRPAPADDRPFQADRWSVISDMVPGTIIACARDLQGREIRIETSPDRARWLAEHLLAAARQVEMISDVDRATADAVRRHSEGA